MWSGDDPVCLVPEPPLSKLNTGQADAMDCPALTSRFAVHTRSPTPVGAEPLQGGQRISEWSAYVGLNVPTEAIVLAVALAVPARSGFRGGIRYRRIGERIATGPSSGLSGKAATTIKERFN